MKLEDCSKINEANVPSSHRQAEKPEQGLNAPGLGLNALWLHSWNALWWNLWVWMWWVKSNKQWSTYQDLGASAPTSPCFPPSPQDWFFLDCSPTAHHSTTRVVSPFSAMQQLLSLVPVCNTERKEVMSLSSWGISGWSMGKLTILHYCTSAVQPARGCNWPRTSLSSTFTQILSTFLQWDFKIPGNHPFPWIVVAPSISQDSTFSDTESSSWQLLNPVTDRPKHICPYAASRVCAHPHQCPQCHAWGNLCFILLEYDLYLSLLTAGGRKFLILFYNVCWYLHLNYTTIQE